MAPTNRLRYNGMLCGSAAPKLGAALTNTATAITLPAQLNYQGATAVPTVADPNYINLTIDPDTANEEIVWLTAYTSAATTGTILRGQEGTTAVSHLINAPFVHGPTVLDAPTTAGMTQIASQTLGASAASITFSSIPSTYTSLWLVGSYQGDTNPESPFLRFNGDTGSDYGSTIIQSVNNTVAGNHDSGYQTQYSPGLYASGVTTHDFISLTALIINYASTTKWKSIQTQMGSFDSAITQYEVISSAGTWANLAAMTSLVLSLTSGNYIAATEFTLYGLA